MSRREIISRLEKIEVTLNNPRPWHSIELKERIQKARAYSRHTFTESKPLSAEEQAQLNHMCLAEKLKFFRERHKGA